MSYSAKVSLGEEKAAIAFASASDPTDDIEVTIKDASFKTSSQVARALRQIADKIEELNHPPA